MRIETEIGCAAGVVLPLLFVLVDCDEAAAAAAVVDSLCVGWLVATVAGDVRANSSPSSCFLRLAE